MEHNVCGLATAAVLLHAVPSFYEGVSEQQLPLAVRLALHKVHEPAARGGAGSKEFSRHEDAIILLKHVRDGIPLAQIKLVGRGEQAAKNRWQTLKLQLRDYLHELRVAHAPSVGDGSNSASQQPVEKRESEALQRLEQLHLDLPTPVRHALIKLHAEKDPLQHDGRQLWSIEEDAALSASRVFGGHSCAQHNDPRAQAWGDPTPSFAAQKVCLQYELQRLPQRSM